MNRVLHRRPTLSAAPAALLALGALAAPAVAETLESIPMSVTGGFVFRVDPNGDAVCRYEPDFPFPVMPMPAGASAAAIDDPLFCALYIDGVLQPPYPGSTGKHGSGVAASNAIPAPGAASLLLVAGLGAASRRRR